MTSHRLESIRTIAAFLSLFLIVGLWLTLLLTDFTRFGLFFLAFLTACLLWWLWQRIRPRLTRRSKWIPRLAILTLVAMVLSVLLFLFSIRWAELVYQGPILDSYTATLTFLDEDSFEVEETIVFYPGKSLSTPSAAPGVPPPADTPPVDEPARLVEESAQAGGVSQLARKETLTFEPRTVEGSRLGLITKEVTVTPLEMDEAGQFSRRLADGTRFSGEFCPIVCPDTVIVLKDFPAGFFNEARYATDLEISPYANTETVSWQVVDPPEGVIFSYFSPPFHRLRPLFFLFSGSRGASAGGTFFLTSTFLLLVPLFLFKIPEKLLNISITVNQGDQITIGDLINSPGVAAGRQATATVIQQEAEPPPPDT